MKPYDQPLYYEIAFSFFDVRKQCDLIEKLIAKYSQIPVRRCLDIACGPSLQLRELGRRGYRGVGLDRSWAMLGYLREKALEGALDIQTVRGDLTEFALEKKVDLAFIMMGSISLIEGNTAFLSHLDSVARSLKKGGLYLVENAETDWAKPGFFGSQSWISRRDGITIETTYELHLKDTLAQTAEAVIRFDINDHGREYMFEQVKLVKVVFPQEFLALIELNGRFEFIGWFEPDSMKMLKRAKENNIAVLRRI